MDRMKMYEDRLIELRQALRSEDISYSELAEIDALAEEYGVTVTEDMMAGDILDAIEADSGCSFECDECENMFLESEGRPYALEPERWLCEDCEDHKRDDV